MKKSFRTSPNYLKKKCSSSILLGNFFILCVLLDTDVKSFARIVVLYYICHLLYLSFTTNKVRAPNVVRERFSFALITDKSSVIKSHHVLRPSLIDKRLGPSPVPFRKFECEFLNNLETVGILAYIPRSFERNPTNWLAQLKTYVKVGQSL